MIIEKPLEHLTSRLASVKWIAGATSIRLIVELSLKNSMTDGSIDLETSNSLTLCIVLTQILHVCNMFPVAMYLFPEHGIHFLVGIEVVMLLEKGV